MSNKTPQSQEYKLPIAPTSEPKKEKTSNFFEMTDAERAKLTPAQLRKLGSDATFKEGGKVSSASSRADGCATKGKTRGKMI